MVIFLLRAGGGGLGVGCVTITFYLILASGSLIILSPPPPSFSPLISSKSTVSFPQFPLYPLSVTTDSTSVSPENHATPRRKSLLSNPAPTPTEINNEWFLRQNIRESFCRFLFSRTEKDILELDTRGSTSCLLLMVRKSIAFVVYLFHLLLLVQLQGPLLVRCLSLNSEKSSKVMKLSCFIENQRKIGSPIRDCSL